MYMPVKPQTNTLGPAKENACGVRRVKKCSGMPVSCLQRPCGQGVILAGRLKAFQKDAATLGGGESEIFEDEGVGFVDRGVVEGGEVDAGG